MTRAQLALFLLCAFPLFAFESRLVDSQGRAIAGAQVSIAGQTGSARTDANGRFTLAPDPPLPTTLIVIGRRGEIFPPAGLEQLGAEIRLDEAFRDSVTVSSGAAPNIEASPAAAPLFVGAEELEQRKPAHLADAIAATPGIALRGEGPPAVPVVRGLTGGRTLLIVDDARIVSERRAGPSATFLNPFILGSIDDADRTGTGVYATYETRVMPALQLGAGARANRITSRTRGGYFGDRERDDVAFSGHVAATTGPFRGVTATLQAASGYREPSLSDRYFRGISGRGFVTGNPDLEPERSLQFDAALRWSGARSTLALFAYHYGIENLVERFRSGNDFFFRNRGEAEIRGIELEAATRIARDFHVHLGASYARGEDAGSGAALDDIGAPALHASLRWAAARTSAFITASAFARDDRPGPVETTRPGYVHVDVGTGWRIAEMLELRVAIRNATNSRHFGSPDAGAALAPGRSVMIGLNR